MCICAILSSTYSGPLSIRRAEAYKDLLMTTDVYRMKNIEYNLMFAPENSEYFARKTDGTPNLRRPMYTIDIS